MFGNAALERVVMEAAGVDDDLVRDMTEILTLMCARFMASG